MTKPVLTGAELEAKGFMKFTCEKCRDLFPRRCDAHHRLVLIAVEEEPEPDHRKLELLTRLERVVPKRKLLASAKPIPEYTAPYEHLEADIRNTLSAVRD